MLGDAGEGGGDLPAVGVSDRGHPIEPPGAGQAAELADDAVEAVDQVRLGHRRGEHPAPAARMRQRADQQIRGLAPAPRRGWVRQLDPVPLGFLTRRMLDHRVRALRGARAGWADRAQVAGADLAGQRLIRRGVAEVLEFVAQGPRPQVRVLAQPGRDVVDERLERVLTGAFAHTGGGGSVQVVADGASVAAGVPGDRRDRPASLVQCVYLHIVLPCQHEKAGLLRGAGAWSETTSIEGDPPSSAEPHG
ncbi:hypothetical protein EBESD8_9540 [Rhodococcus aetherivorans]|nr:hypothetical protein EBESD8_9540 [Rhodococcus aetherivorans]